MESEERYRYLINARNFHYDNFNKWMTYFYVAIGALFIGYYTIKTSQKEDLEIQEISLLILGYLTSLFWYWSSKGYYFWNINFIMLVNDCEQRELELEENERVYSVFANKKTQNNYLSPISGANISTSKVAILFAFVIAVVWGFLLYSTLLERYSTLSERWHLILNIVASIVTTGVFSLIVPRFFLKSKIDHIPDLKLAQDELKE